MITKTEVINLIEKKILLDRDKLNID